MNIKKTGLLLASFVLPFFVHAQSEVSVKVLDENTNKAIEAVTVSVNDKPITRTDKNGVATLKLDLGKTNLRFTNLGYLQVDTLITVPLTQNLIIRLADKDKQLEEITVVASSRNNVKIESSPLKVEILGREEMDEESAVKPAGIASILGDVSGVQIQQSSAVNGNANVRIQGLDGRYTQILKDGMPLYDGFSGGFGILSIPPLDLKQVELIKGSASTLYGGGAIGGLINIISRKPTLQQEAVVSLNQTTLKETNLSTYLAKRKNKIGYTFFGGYNYQTAVDVNGDGFSDVTDLNSLVLHPRFYCYPNENTTIIAGYNGTFETRTGGDMQVLKANADAVHQFFEENTIRRNSYELSAKHEFAQSVLEFKNSLSTFNRKIKNNDINFTGNQLNYYTELSWLVPYKTNSFVIGLNAIGDSFKKITKNIPLNDFQNGTLGIFAQNTWAIQQSTVIEAGVRDDYHFTYGNFFLPRLAIFHHLDQHWATRAGIGLGYKTPNALAPQTVDYAIQSILPLQSGIKAEKSVGYNAEINYKLNWGDNNELFINQAFFLTQINRPIVGNVSNNGQVLFANENKAVVSKGFDTYVRTTIQEWELYLGYTYTIAERKYLAQNQFIPLTPKNRFAFTVVRDFEEAGLRFGIEGSYTGMQRRVDYTHTPGYLFLAAMIEKKIGSHFSLVLNGENLLDYRQSSVEPIFTGSISHPDFSPLWAPIDGRVLNLSVKWKL